MEFDILVVGSGIVGATFAHLVARHPQLTIGVLEAKTPVFDNAYRVSAISLAAKNIFKSINIWNDLHASPYEKMFVWDANSAGSIQFDCKEMHESALGFIVADNLIRQRLHEKFSQQKNIRFLCPIQLIKLHEENNQYALETNDGKILRARLIVAADGANSWMRNQAQMTLVQRDYEQTAIVTTVTTEFPHEKTAWQRFLPEGPLAFLPLENEMQSSIVWSTSPENAKHLLQCEENEFKNKLTQHFAEKLGKIITIEQRFSFPLRMQHAKNYLKNNLVLIGDAAHAIHPLAGQGVNLGLKDAKCLVDVITAAQNNQKDFSDKKILRRFERTRKSENAMMLFVVDKLKDLFSNESSWLSLARGMGLSVTNRIGLVKNFLAQYAMK